MTALMRRDAVMVGRLTVENALHSRGRTRSRRVYGERRFVIDNVYRGTMFDRRTPCAGRPAALREQGKRT